MAYEIKGLSCSPHYWGKAAIDLARIIIAEQRKIFVAGPDETTGRRHNDDEHVINLLRSSVPEEQFALGCDEWTKAALHAAASADQWYSTEKDYGESPSEEVDTESKQCDEEE